MSLFGAIPIGNLFGRWLNMNPNGKLTLDMLPSPIEYCLAEPSASHCSVGLNWYFLLVVAVCNALKLICRLLSLRILRKTEDGPDVDGWGPAPQCRREAPVEPSLQLVWQFLSLV